MIKRFTVLNDAYVLSAFWKGEALVMKLVKADNCQRQSNIVLTIHFQTRLVLLFLSMVLLSLCVCVCVCVCVFVCLSTLRELITFGVMQCDIDLL